MDINGIEEALRLGCTVRVFCIDGVMTAAFIKRELVITSHVGRRLIRGRSEDSPLYRWLVQGNVIEGRKEGDEIVFAAKRKIPVLPPREVIEEVERTGDATLWDRGDIVYRTAPDLLTTVVYAPSATKKLGPESCKDEETVHEAKGIDVLEIFTRLASALATTNTQEDTCSFRT